MSQNSQAVQGCLPANRKNHQNTVNIRQTRTTSHLTAKTYLRFFSSMLSSAISKVGRVSVSVPRRAASTVSEALGQKAGMNAANPAAAMSGQDPYHSRSAAKADVVPRMHPITWPRRFREGMCLHFSMSAPGGVVALRSE